MFNALLNFSLRQRLLVLITALLLLLAGVYYGQRLPVDVFPDLNRPTVTIMTESTGMAPEEIETLISIPIESALNGLPGVTRVRSVSGVGLSVIYVEFAWDTDIYRNRQMVAERLTTITQQLPPAAHTQMAPIASIMGEILLISLASDGADMMKVRDIAEYQLRPNLLSIPGVAQVIAIGGELREWRVAPDPIKLHATDVELDDLRRALQKFGQNTSGGFLDSDGSEFLIRHQGRSRQIDDLRDLVIAHKDEHPIRLSQVADVSETARTKRGDAGFNAEPAVVLSVQKQPSADTLALTKAIEQQLQTFNATRADGISPAKILFRQASFIEQSLANVTEALRDGAIMVAVVLMLFLASVRPTLISLLAIPLSLLISILAFTALGLSINTMTLGGIAIAVGELVDDAVVDVENILRRLKSRIDSKVSILTIVREASLEVRSGIVYATVIVVLVFVPLFALPGIEGRLFTPLGQAYIIAILASLLVSITITPVLGFYLLPKQARQHGQDSWLVKRLKAWDEKLLTWSFPRTTTLLQLSALLFAIALIAVLQLPRSFLPPFNEGTVTIDMQLKPGIALAESNKIGQIAEQLVLQVPGVVHVGRRTGRAEQDEHAEGVHYSELDVDLDTTTRDKNAIVQEIRQKLSVLPVAANVGQPISHRLDHLMSGVRAEIVIKVFGDDLDTLRGIAEQIQQRLLPVAGVTDLRIEKQVRVPQITVQIDYARAAEYGVIPSDVLLSLEQMVGGETVTEIIDGNRRIGVTLRLKDENRHVSGLRSLMVPARNGHVPLSAVADIVERDGPNQIGRDNGRRRIIVSANHQGRSLSATVEDIEKALQEQTLPSGYSYSLEGQYQAQRDASLRVTLLSIISLTLIFIVLYQRYRSLTLTGLIMMNIPLALIGSVIALWLAGQPLSVASMIGFVTLAGISARNGILKISHYINLMAHEGEQFGRAMVIRGSLERLVPVLMTAITAAIALLPLVFAAGETGKEILHPVALVIFGGLISSTLLDTLITPALFLRYGQQACERLLQQTSNQDMY